MSIEQSEDVLLALRHLPTWRVITPEYTAYGGYMEPPERWQDMVEVEAETKRDALVLGVKIMRDNRSLHRYHSEIASGENPFAGLTVELVG